MENKECGIFVMMRTESVSCYHEENRLFVCFVFTTRTECACFCHEETKECGFMSWGAQSVGLYHEETRVWVSVIRKTCSVGFCHDETRECGFVMRSEKCGYL